ncbi:MAG: phosphopentomutase [Acidobacteria bacterium]|nr:phosphopentomutase [Acidobacteriota bacterium]
MAPYRRIIWIVLDSVGIGEMPDAAAYGDEGSDTLGNIARHRGLALPNLCRIGLGNIKPLAGLAPAAAPTGAYGKIALRSPGKDTTTGHWEMAGILLDQPLPMYPHGFPPDVMDAFERAIGRGWLANKPASGTEIIAELGDEHVRTGKPIVYTSADSVFQIAAHEEVIPIPELYRMCEAARAILTGPHEVGRVIARPFLGSSGAYTRTSNRKDFATPPRRGMLLDQLAATNPKPIVYSVGKIYDVFLGRGIGPHVKTKTNADGMVKTLEALDELNGETAALLWTNLVDFDMLYGHRNNVEGYATALEEFDAWLPELLARMHPDDLLILTADHGCDPTTPSTDHSREYVPLLACGARVKPGAALGTRETLADIGQTVAGNFGTRIEHGTSLLPALAP